MIGRTHLPYGGEGLEMNRTKVLITGSQGLVGTSILSLKNLYPEYNFIGVNHNLFDLTKEEDVLNLFEKVEPDYVIHTAARVGGIGRNINSPGQQFHQNILMNTHVIHHAAIFGVKKLIAFSSVCAFPANSTKLCEDNLHEGPPYAAHGAYAHSKRMVDVQIEAYKKEYGVNYCSVIPGNIFGEDDNFNLEDGHVVPSLIHRCFLAKKNNEPFEVWGTGKAKREFLYAKDVARVCLDLLKLKILPQRLVVSGEREFEIKEIIQKISNIYEYDNISWLSHKPDGQLSRPSDKTIFNSIMPEFKFTDIEGALIKTINWFIEHYPNIRK